MSQPNATDARVSTWPNRNYVELDKAGTYPLQGQVLKSNSTVAASGVPDTLNPVQLVNITAAPYTLTFPAALTNYVGKEFTFATSGALLAGRTLNIVFAGGAQMINPGDTVLRTSAITTAGASFSMLRVYVVSATSALVTGVSNMTFT